MFDHERFKNIAAGFQSWLVSLALLVGGVWTVYVFHFSLQIENSRAQLSKLNRELLESPKLEIDLQVAAMRSPSKQKRYFECHLVVKNVGTKGTSLIFGEHSVVLSKVTVLDDGTAQWKVAQKLMVPTLDTTGGQGALKSLVALPGMTARTALLLAVDTPGLYVLSVQAKRSEAEVREAKLTGAPNSDILWGAERYFLVE